MQANAPRFDRTLAKLNERSAKLAAEIANGRVPS